MNLRLQRLLIKLGELKKCSPPTRHEVSAGSGIELATMTRVFSMPQTRLRLDETEKLVAYLFHQFRPLISTETSDEQLWNQLRFELVEFEFDKSRAGDSACAYSPDGKFRLKDIAS
jgi:hypothetical protein